MDNSKLKIRWNFDSNGVSYPEEYIINEEDIEWFKSIPDDELITESEEHFGSPQYHFTYLKSNIDSVTVMGRKRIRGRDKIGTLVKDENGDYKYEEKTREDTYYCIQDKNRISSDLGIPYDEIDVDEINRNLYLHNGNPIVYERRKNEKTGNIEKVLTEVKENPFYERLLRRIRNLNYYRKIGNFLVTRGNTNYNLAGLYKSEEEEQEEFNKLLEYLEYDVDRAEKIFGAFNREKTEFDMLYSNKHRKDSDIVEILPDSKEGLDKILLMAKNGSLSARSFLEARTLNEEKDDLEGLINLKYYEKEFSEEGLKEKLSEDFERTVANIYYDLNANRNGDFFEVDSNTGEDITLDNEARAKVIQKVSEDPKMRDILLQECKKRGIDISGVSEDKLFEYVGIMYSYLKDNEVKFIEDQLPSLVIHSGEMETIRISDDTILHREKVDYSKQNERFVNELMNNPNIKLVYLSKTSNNSIGKGYYDLLVAVSIPDQNGVSRVLSKIPIPVLKDLGVDIHEVMNGESFKGKFVGIADGIGENDDIYSLNESEEVIYNMSNIRKKVHSIDEVSEVMMRDDTNLDDINSVVNEFTREVKSKDKKKKVPSKDD